MLQRLIARSEEQHDDQLLHELLRCFKALSTSASGCQALRSSCPTPFVQLVSLLYSDKKPGDVASRQLITELILILFQLFHPIADLVAAYAPAVTFTRPQLASAGLTEEQALARGHACTCRVLGLADVPRALVNHDTRGAVKLVADAATGKVLGVHAVADGAGELMLAATYAIKAGMTVDDLADTWAPYLTMAESLRLAAGLFRGEMPTSCCA